MKKVNLKIEDYEDKKSQAGKRYTRFKTNEGWMSAFDKDVIQKLKDNEGKSVSVSIAIDEERGFKNIRQFHGPADESFQPVDEVIKIKDPVINRNATMYTSYAKDIFNNINEHKKVAIEPKELMNLAIELVKQAKKEFE